MLASFPGLHPSFCRLQNEASICSYAVCAPFPVSVRCVGSLKSRPSPRAPFSDGMCGEGTV